MAACLLWLLFLLQVHPEEQDTLVQDSLCNTHGDETVASFLRIRPCSAAQHEENPQPLSTNKPLHDSANILSTRNVDSTAEITEIPDKISIRGPPTVEAPQLCSLGCATCCMYFVVVPESQKHMSFISQVFPKTPKIGNCRGFLPHSRGESRTVRFGMFCCVGGWDRPRLTSCKGLCCSRLEKTQNAAI